MRRIYSRRQRRYIWVPNWLAVKVNRKRSRTRYSNKRRYVRRSYTVTQRRSRYSRGRGRGRNA